MSIVLVIIGLIIGGVLVGQDLISVAKVRSQISQIEKYQTAVNTFKLKYGYLPGDMPGGNSVTGHVDPNSPAGQFGFNYHGVWASGCGGYGAGICGDGNDVIENNAGSIKQSGEAHLFWLDLAQAGLISEKITNSRSPISSFLPTAKLGDDKYIRVCSGGVSMDPYNSSTGNDSVNYYFLDGLTPYYDTFYGKHSIKVSDANSIDTKIDDGLPQSGNVMAVYGSYNSSHMADIWVGIGTVVTGLEYGGAATTVATPYVSTNCYDNNGVVGVQKYQMKNANRPNCGLSIKFK